MENLARVREFHETYGCTIDADDTLQLRHIRARLVLEEAFEVAEALVGTGAARGLLLLYVGRRQGAVPPQPLEAVAKETADLRYVTDGTDLALRIDSEEANRRVHASNMTKTRQETPAGQTKVQKGPDYRPPDMTGVVLRADEGAA